MGNLGDNPVLRFTQKQVACLSFRIACGQRYKNSDGEWVERTEWVPMVVYGNRAESLNDRLHKGSTVTVTGEFTTRSYVPQNRETNDPIRKVYVSEIKVGQIIVHPDRKPQDETTE